MRLKSRKRKLEKLILIIEFKDFILKKFYTQQKTGINFSLINFIKTENSLKNLDLSLDKEARPVE